jgi:hypothetical protein
MDWPPTDQLLCGHTHFSDGQSAMFFPASGWCRRTRTDRRREGPAMVTRTQHASWKHQQQATRW